MEAVAVDYPLFQSAIETGSPAAVGGECAGVTRSLAVEEPSYVDSVAGHSITLHAAELQPAVGQDEKARDGAMAAVVVEPKPSYYLSQSRSFQCLSLEPTWWLYDQNNPYTSNVPS